MSSGFVVVVVVFWFFFFFFFSCSGSFLNTSVYDFKDKIKDKRIRQ